jgi:hypothetical protein
MVDVRTVNRRVELSRGECWLLYTWLGQDAPFVRSQLSVVRNGGTAAVRISSRVEASEVLAAIATRCADPDALTGGLRSLRMALGASVAEEVA